MAEEIHTAAAYVHGPAEVPTQSALLIIMLT